MSDFAPLAPARFLAHRTLCLRRGRQLPVLIALLGTYLLSGLIIPTFNMADEEVATRAPESDVKEPSMISSEDTPAQKGASMGVRNVAPAS